MPPKTKFSKQKIIDAAFDIAREQGIDGITIRKVANELGSSIAPIYVNFNDVEELKHAVVVRVAEISKQMLMEQDSGQPFHDIGVASLRFAREYSVLYKDFILNQKDYMDTYDQEMGEELIGQMKRDSDLDGFTDGELMVILLKMRVFTTGLSMMAASEMLPEELDEERLVGLLDSAAADIIAGSRIRKEGEMK